MTYVLAFLFVLTVFFVMAIGVVFGNRPIQGSCGGLNCKLCERREDCPKASTQIAHDD